MAQLMVFLWHDQNISWFENSPVSSMDNKWMIIYVDWILYYDTTKFRTFNFSIYSMHQYELFSSNQYCVLGVKIYQQSLSSCIVDNVPNCNYFLCTKKEKKIFTILCRLLEKGSINGVSLHHTIYSRYFPFLH